MTSFSTESSRFYKFTSTFSLANNTSTSSNNSTFSLREISSNPAEHFSYVSRYVSFARLFPDNLPTVPFSFLAMSIEISDYYITNHGSLLEGVTYDERTNNLYYLDIRRGLLHIHHDVAKKPVGVPRSIKVSQTIGIVGLTEDPNVLIIAAHTEVFLLDLTTEKLSVFTPLPNGNTFEGHQLRSNEGAVTPTGQFWVGTMSAEKVKGNWGTMWQIESNGAIGKVWDANTAIPNGVNWDLVQGKMYWTESAEKTIYSYDYDVQTGHFDLASKKVFYHNPNFHPDGSCLDSQGNLYTAIYGEGKVYRLNKHGQVDMSFSVPAKNVTCCVFGGKNFDQLFITTGIQTADPKDPNDLGGAMFMVDMKKYGVHGQPKFHFKFN